MSKAGERLIESAKEVAAIARGEKPMAQKEDTAFIPGFLCVDQVFPEARPPVPVMIGLGSIQLVKAAGGWTQIFIANDRLPISVDMPFDAIRRMIREASGD